MKIVKLVLFFMSALQMNVVLEFLWLATLADIVVASVI
jgi:hypothetical protein